VSSGELRGAGEVAEDEAGPELAATYARLKLALGVDFVPTVYRMLGVHEVYLRAATDAVAGLIAGEAGERFAAEARRGARTAAARMPPASIALGGDGEEITALFDRYNTANPRNLLFARALNPRGPTDPGAVMGPSDREPAGADVESILAEVLDTHGGFVQPGMWRELAAYPEVLAPAWQAVAPLGRSPVFQEARSSITELAGSAAAAVSPPDAIALGLAPEEARAVEQILNWFIRGISAMIVEIEYLREHSHG